MKHVAFLAVLGIGFVAHLGAAVSPDGRTTFAFALVDGQPRATVRYGQKHLASVTLGLQLEEPFEAGFSVEARATRRVDGSWKTVWGDRAEVRDCFAEETVTLRENGARKRRLQVLLRAYDEGCAFRYRVLGDGELVIRDELTAFAFPSNAVAWGIDRTEATVPEKPFPLRPFAAAAAGRTLLMPLTLQVPGRGFASLLEAHVVHFPRAELTPFDGGVKIALKDRRPIRAPGGFSTPWRALVLGGDAAALVGNATLVLNLNPPCALADTAWIKPGLTVSNLSNCPLSDDGLKRVVDLECTNNVKYLQLDWGWYGTEWGWSEADRERYLQTNPEMKDEPTWRANTTGNVRRVARGIVPYVPSWKREIPVDFDMEGLIAHLKARGMGLCLYVRGAVLEKENVDELFALYAKWGVAGVKPGFVRYGDAAATDWNREIVRLAAKHRLWVDVHDLQIPDGLERTYPNLFLTEGGGGEEGKHPVRQDVTLPFTRCLAGPFDYTPLLFLAGRSHAHAAAMLLVYPGPTAVLRGRSVDRFSGPHRFAWGPELEFVRRLPMTYDESRVLDAEIGARVVVARRRGETWFVGGLNGAAAAASTVDCAFLPPGETYRMFLWRDDFDRDALCRHCLRETRLVTCGDRIEVPMDAAGGFLATFDRVAGAAGAAGVVATVRSPQPDGRFAPGNRETEKDAFHFHKANWNPEPELYLVGAARGATTNATQTVVVFANTLDVWLRVNGQVIGMRQPDARKTCIWKDVPLRPGANELDLRGGPFVKKATWLRTAPPRP